MDDRIAWPQQKQRQHQRLRTEWGLLSERGGVAIPAHSIAGLLDDPQSAWCRDWRFQYRTSHSSRVGRQ
eukprot:72671-Rhodomonas_salina.2